MDSELREKHIRHLGLFDPSEHKDIRVVIVGAGAVGSWTALMLTKLGILNIDVVDFDEVTIENIGPQFYNEDQLGMPKVSALKVNVVPFADGYINDINEKFHPSHVKEADIVIMAVDKMDIRKEIIDACTMQSRPKFIIDARTGGQVAIIYAIPNKYTHTTEYLRTKWHKDEDSVDVPCGERAIIDVQAFVAGVVTRMVRQFLTEGEFTGEVIFDAKNLMIINNAIPVETEELELDV